MSTPMKTDQRVGVSALAIKFSQTDVVHSPSGEALINHVSNRPCMPNKTRGAALYKLYRHLYDSQLDLSNKWHALEAAAASPSSWLVMWMTPGAFIKLRDKSSEGVLRRGHPVSRAQRGQYLFGVEKPLTQKSMLEYFFRCDTTVLCLGNENAPRSPFVFKKVLVVPEGVLKAKSYRVESHRETDQWIEAQVSVDLS